MREHALKRLRNRLASVTLNVALAEYQRTAILREFDEWAVRELGRSWKEKGAR